MFFIIITINSLSCFCQNIPIIPKSKYIQLIEIDSISFKDIGFNFFCFKDKDDLFLVINKCVNNKSDSLVKLKIGYRYQIDTFYLTHLHDDFLHKIHPYYVGYDSIPDSNGVKSLNHKKVTNPFRIITINNYNLSYIAQIGNLLEIKNMSNCKISPDIKSKFGINFTGWKVRFFNKYSRYLLIKYWKSCFIWYRAKFLHESRTHINTNIFLPNNNIYCY